MSTKARQGIRYGNVEVSDDDLAPDAVRRRISIMVPEDVLARLKTMAGKQGIGYQTLINQILRDSTMGRGSIVARLDRIERAVTRRRA